MRIAVLGANGRTGREVVRQALARGWAVNALVRDAGAMDVENPSLAVIEGDARAQADIERVIAGCDAVISALGSHSGKLGPLYAAAARSLVAAMPAAGARRLLVLSTRALGDTSAAGDDPEAPLASSEAVHDDLRQMEQVLRASDLEWTIMRPSRLIAGDLGRYETRVGAVFERGRETRRADLAEAMLDAIESGLWIREDVAIVSC